MIEVRDFGEPRLMFPRRVLEREKRVEPAAVLKDFQRLLVFPIGGGQHQKKHDKIFGRVRRRKPVRALQNPNPVACDNVKVLAIGMVLVAQGFERLLVNLRRRHDPQDKAGLGLAIMQIGQVDRLDRQKGLAAAGGYFKAEIGERAAKPVRLSVIADGQIHLRPRPRRKVDFKVRVRVRLDLPFGQKLEPGFNLFQGGLLKLFQFHRSSPLFFLPPAS